MQDLSGQLLKGYELLDRIGAGGFGAVYRARQTTVGREVAIKFILPAYANDLAFIRRFESEANLVARLEHPHIAPLYDFWRDPSGAYLVMRYLRGGSVSGSLQDGAFELNAASLLLDQIASALDFAHRQDVIHRDIKPGNILLDEDGNAYLADFGIAKDLAGIKENKTAAEELAGSLDYIAPEQARSEPITARSDIYSLGITLYEMIVGEHPFKNSSSIERLYKHINDPVPEINTLPGDVGGPLNDIIQKATAKNPRYRYQDALALAAALRTLAGRNGDSAESNLVESLTRREQEILQLIVEGDTNQQIAQKLFLELSTVKWHISRLYKKLGVRSRVQAIVRARDLNLIVPANELEPRSGQEDGISIVLPEPLNPYKGLRAFEPADSGDFFGREALVEHLLARLAADRSGRFLAVVGPSGSGKSSLIKAGLIPAFWQGKLAGSEKWFIVDMQPGARPLDDLEIALTRIAADQAANLRQHLDRDAHGLARAAGLILPNDESELLLVIDQFEELFTLVEDEAARGHFLDLIHGAVSDPRSRVRVIIALRADYYDRPLGYPAFGELVRGHLETLLPLSAEELELAIVNPAQGAGLTFEPGLVATIIEDVNYRPGTLPLLQFTLAELFEQREGRLLTQEAYQALGGAAGALAGRAEELYQEQDAAGREATRQMFLRLVSVPAQVSGTTADVVSTADTRRRVPRKELLSAAADPEQLDEIIDTFAAYRLLSLDHDPATRAATVEVAHEAILREWERLRGWLEESLVDLGLHRQLQRAARDWAASGGDTSFLLRGARLDSFQNWAAETSIVLSGDERQFLQTSIEQREQRAAAERERQEQEARLERQSNRRLKALVAVMAVALLLSTGLAVAAFSFAQRAEEQQRLVEEKDRLSLANELSTAALANLEKDPELSVLLALQAAESTYAVDGTLIPGLDRILRQVVQADHVHTSIPRSGALAYSPDGDSLVIGDEGGLLSFWNVTTDELDRFYFQDRHSGLISDLKFSQDGRILATSSVDSLVKTWDISSGRLLSALVTGAPVNAIAVSPDGDQIAAASTDGSIQIWDVSSLSNLAASNKEIQILREPDRLLDNTNNAGGLNYSPDGRRLATIFPGRGIIVFDTSSWQELLAVDIETRHAKRVIFSPDGNYLAGISDALESSVWDLRTGEEVLTVRQPGTIVEIAFSSDGRALATGTVTGKLTLWDTTTGRDLLHFFGHTSGIIGIAFSPDGRRLAASSAGESTRIWDIDRAGGGFYPVKAHEGKVHDAVFSPDGSKFASTGEDGLVKVWDAGTRSLLYELPGQMDGLFYPAFSPDGERLAAANREGGITIWEAETGKELLALQGEVLAYSAVTFSPDGTRLAAGGQEGIAHI